MVGETSKHLVFSFCHPYICYIEGRPYCVKRNKGLSMLDAYLADKRACRLVFVVLSAPDSLREPGDRGKSLMLQKAEKDSHKCDCPLPRVRLCANSSELNYAPVGSNLLASLTSELVDSSARRYLRRIRYASRATGGKSLMLQKQKKTATNVTVFFWRSRRDLNSRAGIADLHP